MADFMAPIEKRLSPTKHVYTVLVGNVSPAADDKTLREFFAFAGAVGHISLHSDVAGSTQQGSVAFLTAQGAETALLLDGALIVDRPINIYAPNPEANAMSALEQRISAQEEAILLDGEERPAHVEDHGGGHRVMLSGLPGAMPSPPQRASSDEILGDGDGNGSTNSNHGDGSSPSGQRGSREAGAAIAALLKAGYTLGQRAMDFWARVDTNPQVAQARASFKEGLDVVRAKVQEVDEQHAISARVRAFNEEHEIAERASAAWSSAVSTAAPIASSAAEAVKAGAGELGQRAQLAGAELYMKAGADPNVGPAIHTITSWWDKSSSWAQATWKEAMAQSGGNGNNGSSGGGAARPMQDSDL